MAELSTNQLIKIIIGIIVFVVIVSGAYLVFKNKILDFFNNLVTDGGVSNLFLNMIR